MSETSTRDGAAGVARPTLVLAATILASSLSFVDSSVVNVGLPAIGAALRGDAAGLQWTVDAYLLPLSAIVLFGGTLGDRFGRRAILLAGTALFAAASASCAAATSLDTLIAGRAIQGIGAALLMPNSLAILGDAFAGEARGRAIGTWAAVGAATAGLGPPLGGWLIDAFGWRMIFAINLPLAAAALLLAWRYVPVGRRSSVRPIDLPGVALATLGLAGLTFGLIVGSGPAGWSADAWLGSGTGLAAMLAFVAWERGRGADAMLPLEVFASRDFVALTVLTLLLYGALGALVVLLPYTLMEAGGTSAATAGTALLPLTIVLTLLSPLVGGFAGRTGPRPFLAAGSAFVASGCLLLMRADAGSAYVTGLLPALTLIGVGLASAVAPLTAAVLSSADAHLTGTASGLNSAVARTGGLVATACLGQALSASGTALIAAAHTAAAAAAAACFGACICALLLRKP